MLLVLKNILFSLLVPGSVAYYIPLLLAEAWPSFGIRQLVALLPLWLGLGTYLWCVWDFGSYGRGTPAPIDAPRHLVVRGLYHYIRNPMYVGVLTTILGWALFFGSLTLVAYAALVGTMFQLVVLYYEEPILRRLFGREYEDYCRRVPRWLL